MIRSGSTLAVMQAARALVERERAAGFPACPCEAELRALARELETFDRAHQPPRAGPGRPPRSVDVERVRELRAQELSWEKIHRRTGVPIRTLRRAVAKFA